MNGFGDGYVQATHEFSPNGRYISLGTQRLASIPGAGGRAFRAKSDGSVHDLETRRTITPQLPAPRRDTAYTQRPARSPSETWKFCRSASPLGLPARRGSSAVTTPAGG